MRTRHILSACLSGLTLLGAQSCLKSYVEYFDTSSAERIATYLSDLDAMLGGEQYGWRLEYFVGNEDGDFGGINVALKFDAEKGEVTAMSEENETDAYTSHYVLTTDSGPVLSFDTYNPILHKYGTASPEYYEGRGGDYQFFIIGYDKDSKVVRLKGKRNGKFCSLHPLTESIEAFNARMYDHSRNFYVGTFDGFIGDKKVTGDIDINNRQFTAYEMEVYGNDEHGQPKYDIAETKSVPYILTENGLRFYEPLEIFGTTFEEFDFNFDMATTDTLFRSKTNNISFQGHIPVDWLPYEFFAGDYVFAYGSSGETKLNISLLPTGDRQTFRIKGMSNQFDLMAEYNVRTGRIELRAQHVRVPDTDDVLWTRKYSGYDPETGLSKTVTVDNPERLYIRLCAWEVNGYLTFGTDVGMTAELVVKTDLNGKVDMAASLANPTFRWVDNKGSRSIATDSFLLYVYDTDESVDSPYAGSPVDASFIGGSYQMAYLQTLTKK